MAGSDQKLKYEQAFSLQSVAVLIIGSAIFLEWRLNRSQWVTDGVPWSLVAFGALALLLSVSTLVWLVLRLLTDSDPVEDGLRVIRGVYFLDLVGLIAFMVISRGAGAVVALFGIIAAVTVLFACPDASGLERCSGCPYGSQRFWPWLGKRIREITEQKGYSNCFMFVGSAWVAAVLGLSLGLFLGPTIALSPLGPRAASGPVQFSSWTILLFAVVGLWQILYAQWVRAKSPKPVGKP